MSEVRSGYQQTELGVIPKDWRVAALGNLATFENGDRGENYPSASDFVIAGHPFINAGHLRGKHIEGNNFDYITEHKLSQLRSGKYKGGDVLFCLRGSLGKFGYVSDLTPPGAIASSLIIIRPRIDIFDTGFMCQYFSSSFCSNMIDLWAGGAAQPNLGGQDLARFFVPLPPLSEQKAIAEALRDADGLIEALEALIAKKRAIKQGAMQDLLTGHRRLPGFRGEWVARTLGELAQIYDGTHQTPKYVDDGVPFFSVEHVTSRNFSDTKYISVEEHKFLTQRVKIVQGDVLMTRIGSIGDCKFVDWDFEASFYVSLALLKFRQKSLAIYFVHYSKSDQFRIEIEIHSLAHAVPKKINLGPISNVIINLPPSPDEQNAIAIVLSDMDAEIAALEDKLAKARAVKQGMMQVLLTGEIRLI